MVSLGAMKPETKMKRTVEVDAVRVTVLADNVKVVESVCVDVCTSVDVVVTDCVMVVGCVAVIVCVVGLAWKTVAVVVDGTALCVVVTVIVMTDPEAAGAVVEITDDVVLDEEDDIAVGAV